MNEKESFTFQKLHHVLIEKFETTRRRSIGALEAIRLTLAGAPLADST